MSTFEIAYEQAHLYLVALTVAKGEYARQEGLFIGSQVGKSARYMADSLTLEIERLDAYLKEHKPKGKKGRRK